MKKLLLLSLFVLVALPLAAAEVPAPALADDASIVLPADSAAVPACLAAQPEQADVATLLFETPTATSEACYPAECTCCYPCCRNKCIVC